MNQDIHYLPHNFEFTYCGKSIQEHTRLDYTTNITKVTCPVCNTGLQGGDKSEAAQIEADMMNPNLHTFEIDPKKVGQSGCARCGQSAIVHGAVPDLINHPPHYAPLPNGIRPIDVTQFYNFNLGNALKYIMRAGKKTEDPVQDLQKAQKYLEFELERIKNHGNQS